MGTTRKARGKAVSAKGAGLGNALFAKTQQRVLAVLFGHPERSFYANEIIGLAHSGSGAVQRELARLESSGLVTVTRVGNQKHYQANATSPIFQELRTLTLKTFGLTEVLQEALAPVSPQIRAAFVYGSIAKGEDTANSDIDLMVVADDLGYAELLPAVEEASAKLARTVAPTIYSSRELAQRRARHNAFVMRVWAQPKLWLIGEENDLAP